MRVIKLFSISFLLFGFVISSGCNSGGGGSAAGGGGGGGSSSSNLSNQGGNTVTGPVMDFTTVVPQQADQTNTIEDAVAPLPSDPIYDQTKLDLYDFLIPGAYAAEAPQPISDANKCRVFRTAPILNLVATQVNPGALSAIQTAWQSLNLPVNGSHVLNVVISNVLQSNIKIKLQTTNIYSYQFILPIMQLVRTTHFFVCNGLAYFPSNFHALNTQKDFNIIKFTSDTYGLINGVDKVTNQKSYKLFIFKLVQGINGAPNIIQGLGEHNAATPTMITGEVLQKYGPVKINLRTQIGALKNYLTSTNNCNLQPTSANCFAIQKLNLISANTRYLLIGTFLANGQLNRFHFMPMLGGSLISFSATPQILGYTAFRDVIPFVVPPPPPPIDNEMKDN